MELRHLRYFVAVAEELNFRKAADRLRVAQPALSSQIKDLETELGVRLLDRNTAGVRLTEAGAAFLVETRRTLAQAGQAVVAAQDIAQGRRGQLAVGYSGPLLMGFMPERLQVFDEKYPEVEVSLIEMPMGEHIAGLEAGTIQIGFTTSGDLPLPAGLQRLEILRSPTCLVVGHKHRLAKARSVTLADLVHESVLGLSNHTGNASHGETIRRIFTARALKHGPIKKVDGAEAFRATLECGHGISLIPQMGSLSRSPDLVFKPLKDTGDDLLVKLSVLWSGRTPSVIVDNFIEGLRHLAPAGKKPRKATKAAHGTRGTTRKKS